MVGRKLPRYSNSTCPMLQSFEHMHDVHASEEYEFQTAGCELPAWDRAAVSKFLALMAGTAHLTWEQAAGGTVRTARSTRGDTETRAGPNGETGGFTRQLDPRVGPLHRKTACPGGTQGGPNCLTHSPPRCFPTPNLREADGGG